MHDGVFRQARRSAPAHALELLMTFDLTLHNGRIVTAEADFVGDIGIVDGAIAAIAATLPPGRRAIDATGRLVMPGGIDSHCHVEQLSSMGVLCADDWYTASVSCLLYTSDAADE